MTEINIIFSETWLTSKASKQEIGDLLKQTIKDFVDENDEIINIEYKSGNSGLSAFWIYVKTSLINEA